MHVVIGYAHVYGISSINTFLCEIEFLVALQTNIKKLHHF